MWECVREEERQRENVVYRDAAKLKIATAFNHWCSIITAGPEHESALGFRGGRLWVYGVQVDDVVRVGVGDVLPPVGRLDNLVGPRVVAGDRLFDTGRAAVEDLLGLLGEQGHGRLWRDGDGPAGRVGSRLGGPRRRCLLDEYVV